MRKEVLHVRREGECRPGVCEEGGAACEEGGRV